jgi:hypothetical protein
MAIIAAAVGWENGAFANRKIDWRIGLRRRVVGFDCSVDFVAVATRQVDEAVPAGIMLSIAKSF